MNGSFSNRETWTSPPLQVFKAVADEGGISPAARKLHRVQSNVTTRIQRLEASLGTQLFVREKRRLHLSPAGQVFLAIRRADAAARRRGPERACRRLRRAVSCGSARSRATAASRLPPLLARYHAAHPAVSVELVTGTTDALVEAVLGRRLEAAFVADCKPSARLETMPAFREELVLVAPRSHPGIRRARDVRADTLIVFPTGCAYRRRLQGWLGEDGVVPEKVLELASYHAIVACVASGTGIAIVPRSVLETIRRDEGVAVYPLGKGKAASTTALAWRKGELSPPLKALQAEIAGLRKGARQRR